MKKLFKHLNRLVALSFIFATLGIAGCKKDVSEDPTPETKTYTVSIASTIENGTVTADKTTELSAGEKVTLTVKPASDYTLESLTVTDDSDTTVSTTADADDSTKYTFTMPESNVNVSATFTSTASTPETKTYTVTIASTIENGTVTADKTTGLKAGEKVTLTVTPASDYTLEALTVTDALSAAVSTTVDANDSTKYTFTMPEKNVNVSATFKTTIPEIKTYTVTISSTKNGTVTADKTTDISAGETITLTVYPNSNYKLDKITVTGATVTSIGNKKYTFTMPASNVTVTASFKNIPQVINPTSYKFHETVTKAGTRTIDGKEYQVVYFGDWPQTIKAADVKIDKSKSMTMGDFTYYKGSDDNLYVKCVENGMWAKDAHAHYSDGSTVEKIEKNSEKYFKVEPIKWRVLSKDENGKSLLLADEVLTAGITYYGSDDDDTWKKLKKNRTVNGTTIYPNNYKYSNIRAYLNGTKNQFVTDGGTETVNDLDWTDKGFLQSAFTTFAQDFIYDTEVDNSERSTNPNYNASEFTNGNNSFTCDKTTDKIFLPSVQEVTNKEYGFSEDTKSCWYFSEGGRAIPATDYALANHINWHGSMDPSISYFGTTQLRSPAVDGDSENYYWHNYNGLISKTWSYDSRNGTVPALYVDIIDDYEFHETITSAGTVTINDTEFDLVYFGDWPQTIKAENVIIYEAETMTMGEFTYYKGSDGKWYAKCLENARFMNGGNAKYSDGTTALRKDDKSTKYFKVEPIKWRVLSYEGNKALLLAESALTTMPFSSESYPEVNGTIIQPNNYKYSNIRAYLNGIKNPYETETGKKINSYPDYTGKGFLQAAFTKNGQNKISTTNVDNSARSTMPDEDATKWKNGENPYACDPTKDKVFLLSVQETTKSDYGFKPYEMWGDTPDSARIRKATDYTIANYGEVSATGISWWLRSPDYAKKTYGLCNSYKGEAARLETINIKGKGVVPALYAYYSKN